MIARFIVALAAFACVGCISVEHNAAPAAPAVEAPKNPLDLRRTTIVVRDIEKSLAVYRDALGMTVEYDQVLNSPNLGRANSDGVNRSRLVLLKANNNYIGMLGLWQFLDPSPADKRPVEAADFTPGKIVLLFHATDQERAFAAAAAVPGVKVVSPPTPRRYPSPAGDIEVSVSMLVDPDGHVIELNKSIRDPRRPAAR
jgi:catechol 2,3-dioxygenase-like lactoylglutathione lyase family enzyme